MFPRRYTSQTSSSSPYTASPSSHTILNCASPMSVSSPALNPNTSPMPRTFHRENSNSQSEGMWGVSRSEWSVRALAESGQANGSGTVNGLISHMVPEVPQSQIMTPENGVAPSRRTWRTVPLPSQSTILGRPEITLNPALIFEGDFGGRVMLPMDVATMSVPAILQLAIDPTARGEWATNPPLPSINLIHPALPWSITVHATVTFVTVSDVLSAICQSLQLPLHEEYWSFCVGLGNGYRANPERHGRTLKRLHLLQGKTIFAGLYRTAAEVVLGGDIWRMNFI
ncbi:hypothetical protein GGU10DRAFT_352808 [Lentinula aff. detonsa]|uniref:DUF6699 domain-containing protein n=1 Tax=Lentinula aff. detonsa TaxID=2804958 RepID=A0AA38L4U0_9AGAR|nr:hypothetical protein GGU10DRAFT_352808 [Lentinula aff. detonsa]